MTVGEDWIDNASNAEAVTVTLVRSSGNTERSVTAALRRQYNRHDVLSFGDVKFTGQELIWNIPVKYLTAGDEIEKDDLVTDAAGVVYNVLASAKVSFESRWRLVTKRQR